MTHRHRGFTFVELIIVIAIVSVLLALSIPMVLRVRQHAYNTVCAAQLRQLAQCTLVYASQCRGMLPANAERDGTQSWMATLPAGVRNNLLCPAVSTFATSHPLAHVLAPGEGFTFVGWSSDYPAAGLSPGDRGTFGWNLKLGSRRLDGLKHPLRVPAFADATRPGVLPVPPSIAPNFATDGFNAEEREFLLYQGLCIPRHLGGINVAFLDGHVEAVALDSLLELDWWPD